MTAETTSSDQADRKDGGQYDRDIQVTLVSRTGVYGAACLIYFVIIQIFTLPTHLPESNDMGLLLSLMDDAIYWVPGLLILVPLMVYDLLNITDQFTQPLLVLRKEMHALAIGQSGKGVATNPEGYWADLGEDYSCIRNELLELREQHRILEAENQQLKAAVPVPPETASEDTASEDVASQDVGGDGPESESPVDEPSGLDQSNPEAAEPVLAPADA